MTTAEAICAIPEIVAKAIPLTPYNAIQCPVKRYAALDNANWRRQQLTERITSLIIQHQAKGIEMSIDLGDLGIDINNLK